MRTILGDGEYRYEEIDNWAQLPPGWNFKEVADVAVDADDRVYVFNRSDHPMMVFERDGTFVTSWGEDIFTRAHGLTIGPDGLLYCVDDDGHSVRRCTTDGELKTTYGIPGQPAPLHSGQPFNRPTKVAFDPQDGDLFISDGYANAAVHKYSVSGEHLFSWGDYGTDPGQFNLPHSVCTDKEGNVYVADRENHRVQIFDAKGTYLDQWNNLHRPCGLHVAGDLVYIGQIVTELTVNADYPNLGCCVSVHDLSGRRLARLGKSRPGEGPGQFIAPHGLAVDSHNDIYVGEVSWAAYGRNLTPPREVRSLRKLVKIK